jgi:hypothetical protein
MTSSRRLPLTRLVRLTVAFPLAALLAAGCGNYSNEDLEYMNALPESSDLRANIPPVSSAVQLADEAELARSTHDTTRGFNGMLALLVGIVDTVRSYPPTARTATSRIWGPFPTDRAKKVNLDWEVRLIVSRDQVTPEDKFDYELAVHHLGAADTDWPVFVSGWFKAGASARRGQGHVELVTAAVRAEGLDVTDLGMLDHLEIDYDHHAFPISNTMHITDLPDPGSAGPGPQVDFTYSANAAGQGQMTFDLIGNFITVSPAIEDMRVVSDWLATGEGRATLTVISGDGAGSQQVECWSPSFEATYNKKPWAPGEEVPPMAPADPGALCPTIPTL